jgi:hypothetical protein
LRLRRGVLLCWAPLVGLIPAIIGFIYGRKYGGWMKKWGALGIDSQSAFTADCLCVDPCCTISLKIINA